MITAHRTDNAKDADEWKHKTCRQLHHYVVEYKKHQKPYYAFASCGVISYLESFRRVMKPPPQENLGFDELKYSIDAKLRELNQKTSEHRTFWSYFLTLFFGLLAMAAGSVVVTNSLGKFPEGHDLDKWLVRIATFFSGQYIPALILTLTSAFTLATIITGPCMVTRFLGKLKSIPALRSLQYNSFTRILQVSKKMFVAVVAFVLTIVLLLLGLRLLFN